MDSLRVGTFNAHNWFNADEEMTLEAAARLLTDADLDVFALQEVTAESTEDLVRVLGGRYRHIQKGMVAIVSRLPLAQDTNTPVRHVRHCSAIVRLPCGKCLKVVTVHLNHVCEQRRRRQVHECISSGGLACDILLGDFNSLTRSDYSAQMWDAIASVRSDNAWEAPVAEVTAMLKGPLPEGRKGLAFMDAWQSAASRKGPLSTCRFDTRIDYIYLGTAIAQNWTITEFEHVVAIPAVSDHNLVVVTLSMGSSSKVEPQRVGTRARASHCPTDAVSRVVLSAEHESLATAPHDSCSASPSRACLESVQEHDAIDDGIATLHAAEGSPYPYCQAVTEAELD
jgi:endonuclease/exonuclease/phosphatase family metal-dependent hydrolase